MPPTSVRTSPTHHTSPTELRKRAWRSLIDGLAVHADDEDPAVRALAARDPKVPLAAVERLTRDPDPAVRAAFARHPNLPPSRLAELLDDEELVHHAAANPALPAPAFRALVSTCAGSADGE